MKEKKTVIQQSMRKDKTEKSWTLFYNRLFYKDFKIIINHSFYFSSIILRKPVLRCCKEQFAFFLSEFSFTSLYDSQDISGSGRPSLYILSVPSTRFTEIETLAGLLLQRAV